MPPPYHSSGSKVRASTVGYVRSSRTSVELSGSAPGERAGGGVGEVQVGGGGGGGEARRRRSLFSVPSRMRILTLRSAARLIAAKTSRPASAPNRFISVSLYSRRSCSPARSMYMAVKSNVDDALSANRTKASRVAIAPDTGDTSKSPTGIDCTSVRDSEAHAGGPCFVASASQKR